ncbi:hypothetical protein [Congregibacter litoralis]|uniref:Uncharacterized protein n=1 Tax=Congregibacter litoralis KT71 TaxID=314285 RepID=A4A8F8_9GAMM|nr:hypothetical protein [Congregibacter litoralis]EAQ97953.1 hypothetical protein KT71_15349 [Congregibacter litoralis KT71]
MSAKDTEKRLVRLIAEHHLGGGEGKLTIQVVSSWAGISRQAYNKYYKHLTPYVKGARPIEELLTDQADDVQGLLSKSQERIRELEKEVARLHIEQEKEVEKIKDSYITSLMNSDISLMEADETRKRLQKQVLHNDKLIKDKKECEGKLNDAIAMVAKLTQEGGAHNVDGQEVTIIDVDLNPIYRNYLKTGDRDVLEDEKDRALAGVLKKVNKLASVGDAHVVLYVDRFLASFDEFASSYRTSSKGQVIIVRLPIFSRTELRLFAKNIYVKATKEIWIPHCASETVTKAQRKFSFRDVPDVEKEAADHLATPSLNDGFQRVCSYEVRQGD